MTAEFQGTAPKLPFLKGIGVKKWPSIKFGWEINPSMGKLILYSHCGKKERVLKWNIEIIKLFPFFFPHSISQSLHFPKQQSSTETFEISQGIFSPHPKRWHSFKMMCSAIKMFWFMTEWWNWAAKCSLLKSEGQKPTPGILRNGKYSLGNIFILIKCWLWSCFKVWSV